MCQEMRMGSSVLLSSPALSPLPGFCLLSSFPLLSLFLGELAVQSISVSTVQHLSAIMPSQLAPPSTTSHDCCAAACLLLFSCFAIKIQRYKFTMSSDPIQCYKFTMSSSMCCGSPLSHLQYSAVVRGHHLPHWLVAAWTDECCFVIKSSKPSGPRFCSSLACAIF